MYKRVFSVLAAALLLIAAVPVSAADGDVGALRDKATIAAAENEDIVGFLYVPGTDIYDPVVQGPEGDRNSFYLRRNIQKEPDFEGSYFADFRCVFGETGLSRNTIIYGNSSSEDPAGTRFNQLKHYHDAEFLAENPIIYFADLESTKAWRVFAVSILQIEVPYNSPDSTDEAWREILAEVRNASIHNLKEIEVGVEDQILTLSTIDFSATQQYPNNNRFVVMAKRVDMDTGLSALSADNPRTGR